jgi:hypothetical protein
VEVQKGYKAFAYLSGTLVLATGVGNVRDTLSVVYRSYDGGKSWNGLNHFPGGRRLLSGVAVLHGYRLLLIGGQKGEQTSTPYRDVWSTVDFASTWSRVCEATPWATRTAEAVAVPGGSTVLVIGGMDPGSGGASAWTLYNDVWKSTNNGGACCL